MSRNLEHLRKEERLRDSGLFSQDKKEGDLINAYQYLMGEF